MKRIKRIAGMVCALAIVSSVAVTPAFAENKHWFFEFDPGMTHYCGPAIKDDSEANAYISLKEDSSFQEYRHALRTRVVVDGTRQQATYERELNKFGTYTLPYISGKNIPGKYYLLAGYPSSTGSYTHVRAWGYWCP